MGLQYDNKTFSLLDAGKSTIGGQMMYLTGMVDKRTLEKYEREAKEKNRETWYLSWCMDTNQEGKKFFKVPI
jgi:peptide chain release factor subunit 3